MAINDERDERMHKVSALDDDSLSLNLSTPPMHTEKTARNRPNTATTNRRQAVWRGVLVDIVILVVFAGLCVGVWFGYQAIKNMYQPVFEERAIECVVKIDGIDYQRADDLLPALYESGIWYSDTADGVYMGLVTDVVPVPSVTNDGKEIMTLYLTVAVDSQYYPKDGYFVDHVRMLAGEMTVYRANALIAEGMIISITDPSVDTTAPIDAKGGEPIP